MTMMGEQKRFLIEHLGQEDVDKLEERLARLEKSLRERGIQFKARLEKAEDSELVRQLKQSRHPASRYVLDLIERGAMP